MMRDLVLIVEPNMSGHRPYYVRLLVKAAAESGRRVSVATLPGQFESEDARIHLEGVSDEFERIELQEVTLESVARLSTRLEASQTVIPDGDRFAVRLALSRGWSGAGSLSVLVMREVAQPGKMPGVQWVKTLSRRLLFRRAGALPNVRVAVLKSSWWVGSCEFPIARDPITLHHSSVREERLGKEWGLGSDRYWFAVLGAISQRKNVDLVAQALSDLDTSKVGLLVAGSWDDSIGEEMTSVLERLKNAGASVVVVNRKLHDDELDAAVARVDCLVLAHSNEGPSGLLGKAAAAGTRVVAAGARSLREDLERLPELGTWTSLEHAALVRAFREATRRARPPVLLLQGAKPFADSLLRSDDCAVSSPMRIAQVLLSERVGGAESLAKSLAEEWTSVGVENWVLYVDPLNVGKLNPLARRSRLKRTLAEVGPNIVVGHSAIPAIYARLCAPANALKYSVLHSAGDDFRDLKLNVSERVLRTKTDGIIAVSAAQADVYQKRYGSAIPVHVIPNGIGRGFTFPVPSEVGNEPRLIAAVARLVPQKNPEMWLRAAKVALSEDLVRSAEWWGPEEDEDFGRRMRGKAEELGLNGVFRGSTSTPVEVYRRADILLHTSEREAHSVGLLEAAAMGVPIVCSEEVAATLPSEISVTTFRSRDLDHLVSRLRSVVNNWDESAGIARDQASRVARIFGAAATARSYVNLFEGHRLIAADGRKSARSPRKGTIDVYKL